MHFRHRAADDRGFALLLVIWTLALLTLLSVGLATEVGGETRITMNRLASARARAMADAGVSLGLAGVLDADPGSRWPATGRLRVIGYGGGQVTVSIQDEGGKVDINYALEELLDSLFERLRVGGTSRAALLAGISERRRGFHPPEPRVARTPADLQPAPPRLDPGKLPFADVSELRLIQGVGEHAYETIRPFVTVYAQSASINPMTAPREVLLAIPGIRQEEVEALLAARDQPAQTAEPAHLGSAGSFAAPAELHVATIRAKAMTPAGAAFVRDAVVELMPETSVWPYRILRWSEAGGD